MRPWNRSASPLPGQSTMSVEIPRAASSCGNPERYMCSLVESRPFHMMTHGPPALVKYAGSTPPSNGTSTRVVFGSTRSNVFRIRSRQRW